MTIHSVSTYQPYEIAFLVINLLRVFCNTSKPVIDISILDHPDFAVINTDEKDNDEISSYLIEKATQYWNESIKDYSTLPIEHDFYLKMYQLANTNIGYKYDYILFDECQDANPVIIDIILKKQCQKI